MPSNGALPFDDITSTGASSSAGWCAASVPRGPGSAGAYSAGDLAVVLPVGAAAGQVGILGWRLHLAVGVEGAGSHGVLAGCGRTPALRPDAPGEAGALSWPVQGGGLPAAAVDLRLDPGDRRAPCGTEDGVPVTATGDLGRARLEAGV